MSLGYFSQVLIKAERSRLWYFLLWFSRRQVYILTYFLFTDLPPTFDQAHPVQLRQPNLSINVKTSDLFSYIKNSFQHFRKFSVLGQVGLTG